jgi:hypothetical protein
MRSNAISSEKKHKLFTKVLYALADIGSAARYNCGSGVTPEKQWRANESDNEDSWNPMEVMERVTIPVLALFDERDTQVDPIQGADHNMIVTETGCISESDKRLQRGDWTFAQEYWIRWRNGSGDSVVSHAWPKPVRIPIRRYNRRGDCSLPGAAV